MGARTDNEDKNDDKTEHSFGRTNVAKEGAEFWDKNSCRHEQERDRSKRQGKGFVGYSLELLQLRTLILEKMQKTEGAYSEVRTYKCKALYDVLSYTSLQV